MCEKTKSRNHNFMGNTIAAIILTKDEEKHIARCIESLKGVCEEVFVIDEHFLTNSL